MSPRESNAMAIEKVTNKVKDLVLKHQTKFKDYLPKGVIILGAEVSVIARHGKFYHIDPIFHKGTKTEIGAVVSIIDCISKLDSAHFCKNSEEAFRDLFNLLFRQGWRDPNEKGL